MPSVNKSAGGPGGAPPKNIQIQIDRALAYGRRDARPSLDELLRTLHLPAFRESYEEIARTATAEKLSYEQFLWHLCDRECLGRFNHRTERFLRESRLPLEKSWSSFDQERLPLTLRQQVKSLRDSGFLDRRENVLAFGNPGSGKTHLLCALCQELVMAGRRILYRPCSLLVQELLAAKRDLSLSKTLKHLSLFEGLIIDDIGYVQQSRDEMEVLFTLLAERYERGSVLITSNLAFSGWEAIFKDPMTAAAAIDRLVHHSVILELNLPSYRMTTAQRRVSNAGSATQGQQRRFSNAGSATQVQQRRFSNAGSATQGQQRRFSNAGSATQGQQRRLWARKPGHGSGSPADTTGGAVRNDNHGGTTRPDTRSIQEERLTLPAQ